MKVSKEEAEQKIAEFTQENILGTVILYALIVNVVEPITLKLGDYVKGKIKSLVTKKINLKPFKKGS